MKKPVRLKTIAIRAMKITCNQLILALVCAVTTFATDTSAQSLLEQKVTLQVKEADIRSILRQVEQQTDARFVYSSKLIRSTRKLTLSARQEMLASVLERMLKPLQIDYEVSSKVILLRPAESGSKKGETGLIPRSVLVPATTDQTITGTVRDESNQSLPGATIVAKGTTTGTSTDADGKYVLSVPNGSTTLIYSFVGYLSQEVVIGNRKLIDVVLTKDAKALDEVVIVGYGKQAKSQVIGSIAQIDGDKINNRPVPQLAQSLTGQLPGVAIIQRSGQPGNSGGNIQIRGVGSFGAATTALILVDGIPTNSFNDIDPNDVATISVLKDASSAAITAHGRPTVLYWSPLN